jgi:hypothetical protein
LAEWILLANSSAGQFKKLPHFFVATMLQKLANSDFANSIRMASTQVLSGPTPNAIHSEWSAIIGSIFVARLAGIQQASTATSASDIPITTNVIGSVTLTPNSKLFINRVDVNVIAVPIPTPSIAIRIPWPRIHRIKLSRRAPKAIRMPISRVRCSTE